MALERTAVFFTLLVTGCSTPANDGQAMDANQDVLFVGATNDESLANLLAIEARQEPSKRVTLQSPTEGGVYAVADGLVIEFAGPVAMAPQREPAAPPRRTPWLERVVESAAAQFVLIRSAYAHGAPFNGRGFYLEVTDDSGRVLLEVFTDATSYAVSPMQLSALSQNVQPLQLTVTWGDFDQDLLGPSTGPFLGATVLFTVQ